MLDILLDCFFPRRSLRGEAGTWITPAERKLLKINPVIEDERILRARGLASLDRIIAAHAYHESKLLQKAIQTFKYKRIPGFAQELASLVLQTLPADIDTEQCVICPVPLHWSRRFQRGFNQAQLLSCIIADHLKIPHQLLLRRMRSTGHQAWRRKKERLTALKGAFACTASIPSCVILVDDLSTTGATLDECASVLKAAGAKRVEGWVVAHG